VDVAITTTHLVRAFKPTVTFQVTASDGRIHTFESSVDKFHQVRRKTYSLLNNYCVFQNKISY